VALTAVNLAMLPLKIVPGESMVEIILIKTDHLEFPSMVIIVAGCAFFAFSLGGDMIPSAFPDHGSDFSMAVEAFFVGHLLPQNMTLGAIGHPLKMLV